MNKSIFSLLIILLVISCSSSKNIVVNSKLDKDNVTISKNDSLSVELVSNVSTGYHWVVDSTTKSNKIIFLNEKSIYPETNLVGVAGKQVFIFKAQKKGTVDLIFYYVRGDLDTAKTKTIQIIID